jgi:asparaginyl-tRNA synthetase
MEPLYRKSHTPIATLFEFTQEVDEFVKAELLGIILGTTHTLKGWIRFVKKYPEATFVHMYDGSCSMPLQLVFNDKNTEILAKVDKQLHVGATIEVKGTVVESPAKGQEIEILVSDMAVVGPISDPAKYLPCAKKVPMDVLRKVQHLRPKFKSYTAIYRIRSVLLQSVHDFFRRQGFLLLDPNVITTSDCEGAGEVFTITNLLRDGGKTKIPMCADGKTVDFSQDFFLKQAYLTVSSQLQLEALCAGMGPVYTTNPSFRAEPSKTKRHLCCFTHLEWEMPFIVLKDLMDFSEDLVTYCFKTVLGKCKTELKELDAFAAPGLVAKIEGFVKERFARITYDEAIDILYKEKDGVMEKFGTELKELPKWGEDLGTYCERYLSEVVFKRPVFVHNYPRDLKSFYMKLGKPYEVKREDGGVEVRQTVDNFDMLVPLLGELIGASIREDDYDKLVGEMGRRKMDAGPLGWYCDLRKDATFAHGGAGLGFDRLVSICTSMEGHIKNAVPFPVSYQECDY